MQAIVVYPMNALANSQLEELGKFLEFGYGGALAGHVRAATPARRSPNERQAILANPPDILLTNYVMLELVLTRPDERSSLVKAAQGLQFLVLDELHTYRGRQGADVAMLVRRVREACEAHDPCSASARRPRCPRGGTIADQQRDVAQVATRIFGATVSPGTSSPRRWCARTSDGRPSDASWPRRSVARGDAEATDPILRAGYAHLTSDPLASWIERHLRGDRGAGVRAADPTAPTTVDRAAAGPGELTGATVS